MNPLIKIAKAFGFSIGPIEWFFITIFGYLIFGFGGMSYDFACNRFRNSGTGQFVKWEHALFIGGIIELIIIISLSETMGFFEILSSFGAWFICFVVTILLGLNTRNETSWI